MSKFCYGALTAAATLLLLVVGCGDDTSSSNFASNIQTVSSMDKLGDCGEEQEGDSVYARDEDLYVACKDGFWTMFEYVEDGPDEPEGKSSSSKKTDGKSSAGSDSKSSSSGPSTSSADEKSSSSRITTSLDLYVAAHDTLISLKYLKECNDDREGMFVFVASLNHYLRCRNENWEEFEPTMDDAPKSSAGIGEPRTGKSDLSDFFEMDSLALYSSSSYYYSSKYDTSMANAERVLGPCAGDNLGKVVEDTGKVIRVSYSNLYYCTKGVWIPVSSASADTMGFGTATNGTFKEGQIGTPQKSMSARCDKKFLQITHGVYVYDGGWRLADSTELCFNKMCSDANFGEITSLGGEFPFTCRDKNRWSLSTIYELPVEDHFNKNVSYGTLTDDRDGQTYKTVRIGDYEWMAENLNYAGENSDVGGCYKDEEKNCAIAGRRYTWIEAMQLAATYKKAVFKDSLNWQGICPEGWRIPLSSEWHSLAASGEKSMAECTWVSSFDSYANLEPFNENGLTVLPTAPGSTYHMADFWATTNTADGGYGETFRVGRVFVSRFTKDLSYGAVRCIKSVEGDD